MGNPQAVEPRASQRDYSLPRSESFPCRLIIQNLPDEEVKKRKRNLKARAKKKGKTFKGR